MPIAAELDLLYIYVRDLDRSVRFYRDVLGFPLKGKAGRTWGECTLPTGLRFAINQAGEYEPPTPRTFELSLRTDWLETAREVLVEAQVGITPIEHDVWGDHFHLFDPDGYRLSLYSVASEA